MNDKLFGIVLHVFIHVFVNVCVRSTTHFMETKTNNKKFEASHSNRVPTMDSFP